MKFHFLLIFLSAFNYLCHSQLKKTLADKHFNNLAYYECAPMYAELADRYLQKNKGDKNDILRAAISYGKIFEFEKSNKYYASALKEDQDLFKEQNYLDYINQLRMTGNYQKSVSIAKKALKKHSKNDYFQLIAKKGLDLESIFQDSIRNTIELIPVNSDMGDFSPFFYDTGILFTTKSKNNDFLGGKYAWDHAYFTSIVYSEKRDGKWTHPKILKDQFHSRKHDGPVAFNSDETEMVITHNYSSQEKKDGIRYLALYLSQKNEEGEWSELEAFPHDATNSNTGHGCFGPKGETLYFVSDRKNGKGATDIYYSIRKFGEWQAPINLSQANTEGDEMFPFVDEKNQLYFASNGHLGLGGLDIFKLDLNNKNSQPVNMGAGINSAADDFGLVADSTMNSGFFSSDRKDFIDKIYAWKRTSIQITLEGNIYVKYVEKEPLKFHQIFLINETDQDTTELISDGFGNFETSLTEGKEYKITTSKKFYQLEKSQTLSTKVIYKDTTIKKDLQMNPTTIQVKLLVVEEETQAPIPEAKVAVRQMESLMDTTLTTNNEGLVEMNVDRFEKYWTYGSKKGYIDDETNFKTDSKGGKTISLKLELPKIKLGTKFKLENIFYDYNKASLRDESQAALDKLAEFILKNEVKIELSSHTDSRGSNRYNKNLSQRRAQSCVDYLIKKGVPKSKIIAKGYGESQIVNRCKNGVQCSEEKHQENRRTEVKILEI